MSQLDELGQLRHSLAVERVRNEHLWSALDAAEDDAKRYRWLRATKRCLWRPVALRNVTNDDEADRMVDEAMKDDEWTS